MLVALVICVAVIRFMEDHLPTISSGGSTADNGTADNTNETQPVTQAPTVAATEAPTTQPATEATTAAPCQTAAFLRLTDRRRSGFYNTGLLQ